MKLIVIDTNVVVSAALSGNAPPAKIITACVLRKLQPVTCPLITAEYVEVLRRPRLKIGDTPPLWLSVLIEQSLRLANPGRWPFDLPDASDEVFLALAAETGAWLVTGNIKHYPPNKRAGVVVISPAEYVQRVALD